MRTIRKIRYSISFSRSVNLLVAMKSFSQLEWYIYRFHGCIWENWQYMWTLICRNYWYYNYSSVKTYIPNNLLYRDFTTSAVISNLGCELDSRSSKTQDVLSFPDQIIWNGKIQLKSRLCLPIAARMKGMKEGNCFLYCVFFLSVSNTLILLWHSFIKMWVNICRITTNSKD